jgi:hypothetical protein
MNRRIAALLVVLTGTALVVAACGGGSSAKSSAAAASAPTSTTNARAANRAAFQAFTTCLSQHGVTIPTRTTIPGQTFPTRPPGADNGPPGGGGGAGFGFGLGLVTGVTNNPNFQPAYQACKSTLPLAVQQQLQQRLNQDAAFISCMKDHGETVTGFNPRSTSTTDAAYAAAFNVCKAVLPNGGTFVRRAGTTTTTTTT